MKKIFKIIITIINIILIQVVNAYSNNKIFTEIFFSITGLTLTSFQATSILYVFGVFKEIINYIINKLDKHKNDLKSKGSKKPKLISDPHDFENRCGSLLKVLNIKPKLSASKLPFNIRIFVILIFTIIYKWYDDFNKRI